MLLKKKKQIADLYLWMKNQIANAYLYDRTSNEDTDTTIALPNISDVLVLDPLPPQHLIKTGSAAKLMGTAYIISGISGEIPN